MRIITKARLREFWKLPGCSDAEGPLRAWHTFVSHKSISWKNWSDVKRDYPAASLVGRCVVFNIGGNKYRLVTRILYPSHKVLILKVMNHREYDKNQWKDECHCFEKPKTKSKRSSLNGKHQQT